MEATILMIEERRRMDVKLINFILEKSKSNDSFQNYELYDMMNVAPDGSYINNIY